MTEVIVTGVLTAIGVGLIAYGLNRLLNRDRQIVLDNKCPPHKWEWIDKNASTFDKWVKQPSAGYRCSKCKRKAGELNYRPGNGPMGPLSF